MEFLSGLNLIDIVVIFFMIIYGIKGLKTKLVREAFGIFGIIGGIYFAIKFKQQAGEWVSNNIYNLNKINVLSGNSTEILVGFLVVLFGIWIISLIFGEIFSKLFKLSGLELLDTVGGLVFSAAKVFMIFAIAASITKVSEFLNNRLKPYADKSIIYPYLVKAGDKIMQIDPIKVVQNIENGDIFSNMENNTSNNIKKEAIININIADNNSTEIKENQ